MSEHVDDVELSDMPASNVNDVPSKEADQEMAEAPQPAIPIEPAVPEGASGNTAFFLFSNVHRDRVKQHIQNSLPDGEKATIGMVGKQIGALWQACNLEVKAAYTAAAKLNKAQAPAADAEGTDDAKAAATFPRSLVKRIIMLDADQQRIAADAVDLTCCAAEMFLNALASKVADEATGAARSTVNFRDVESVLSRWKPTAWGTSPFREIENQAPAKDAGPSKALQEAAKGSRNIASFFGQPSGNQTGVDA